MKNYYLFILLSFISLGFTRCGKDGGPDTSASAEIINGNTSSPTGSKIRITVGLAVFSATLYDNQAANAFRSMLPLSLSMDDLNSNEKFYYFPGTLATSAAAGGDVRVGDLMLYGNNCLVLFYKGLNTSISYSRLGKIDNVSGYAEALGYGRIAVKFELQ